MDQCVIIWLPGPIIRLARLGNNPPSCQMTPCVRVGKWRWINWGPEENEAPHYCSSWSWYKSERGPSRYWEVLFVALARTTAPGISGESCKLVRFPPIALDFDQWSGKLAGQCLGGWLTTWRTSSGYLWQTQGRSNKFQEGTHKAFCQISVGDTLATNFKGGAKTWNPMSTPLRTSTEADNTAEEVWAPWPNICGFVFHHIVHCDAFSDLFSITTIFPGLTKQLNIFCPSKISRSCYSTMHMTYTNAHANTIINTPPNKQRQKEARIEMCDSLISWEAPRTCAHTNYQYLLCSAHLFLCPCGIFISQFETSKSIFVSLKNIHPKSHTIWVEFPFHLPFVTNLTLLSCLYL